MRLVLKISIFLTLWVGEALLQGTGTFGRVRLVKFKHSNESIPLALKMLKKTEIIRLKQIEHVKSEKRILERIEHPFIIKL